MAKAKRYKKVGGKLVEVDLKTGGDIEKPRVIGKGNTPAPVPTATTPQPTNPGMLDFDYYDGAGVRRTIQAANADEALKNAKDIGATSGVEQRGVQQTTTSLRTGFEENATKLDERLGRNQVEGDQNGGQVTVVRDQDNGDGTRTVTYSDGTKAKVSVSKNADGSESYKEVGDGETEDDPYGLNSQVSTLTKDIENEKARVTRTLDQIYGQMDAASQGLINALKASYEARTANMVESNKRLLATKETQGIRQGRSRYTQGVQAGILSDEEMAGEERIAALQAELLKGIAEAQYARAEDKMALFNAKMTRLDELDKKLREEVKGLYERAVERDKELREQAKFEREQRKGELDFQTTRADASAEAVAEALDGLATVEEQQAFLTEYSARTGVSPDILLSSVNAARRAKNKAELDIANVENTIYNRNRSQNREDRKEKFNPSADQRAAVGKYLAKYGSDEDTNQAETDSEFFYYILDKAEEEEL